MEGSAQARAIYTASTIRRLVALWLDQIIVGVGYSPALLQIFFSYLRSRSFEVDIRWLLMGWLLAFAYRLCFNYFLGGTIGKLLMGLRLVSKNGELTLAQVVLRVLTDELSWFFGLAPRAFALLRLDRTHISDWVAETQVVQFSERAHPPHRWKILAPLFILLVGISTFLGLYRELRHIQVEDDGLVIFDANG